MSLTKLGQEATRLGLALRGALHPSPEDQAPADTGTLVLLGPDEPRFWPIFTASSEWDDGAPDPLDRWSKRVIGALAQRWDGAALFPSDGPPYPPFLRWARRSGAAWVSPVGLLIQAEAGLFISYRGVLALRARLELPPPAVQPCVSCVAPCLSACPVGALGPGQTYDVPRCKSFIATPEGADCLKNGCRVRRACPISSHFTRLPAQSAFHMAAFLQA